MTTRSRSSPNPPFALLGNPYMNERRARHLLPRPCGLKPHPFTPPLLPPAPLASFLRRQESRGAVSGRGTLTPTPALPPSGHSCESSNPEGPSPRIVIPAKAGIQRGCARAGHPCEVSNPEEPSTAPQSSFLRRLGIQRGRPHSRHSRVKPATQRRGAEAGSPSPSRDSRAEPAPHSDTGQEPRGARLEQGRPSTDRLEMPAPSYRRSRTCWDLPSTACCSRRPHSCSRKR